MQIQVKNISGNIVETIEIADSLFRSEVNKPLLHQALLRELAGQRKGTNDTKTRAEVSGGGKKPRPQKGSGRSRQGSTRSPLWVKGGIAHGPHPRSYTQKMPRKMWRIALSGALSSKISDEQLIVVDKFDFTTPKTKPMAEALSQLGANRSALIVTGKVDATLSKSLDNLPRVKTVPAMNMKLHDIIRHNRVLMTVDAVREAERIWAKE